MKVERDCIIESFIGSDLYRVTVTDRETGLWVADISVDFNPDLVDGADAVREAVKDLRESVRVGGGYAVLQNRFNAMEDQDQEDEYLSGPLDTLGPLH